MTGWPEHRVKSASPVRNAWEGLKRIPLSQLMNEGWIVPSALSVFEGRLKTKPLLSLNGITRNPGTREVEQKQLEDDPWTRATDL